jgi:hypothetical protein
VCVGVVVTWSVRLVQELRPPPLALEGPAMPWRPRSRYVCIAHVWLMLLLVLVSLLASAHRAGVVGRANQCVTP